MTDEIKIRKGRGKGKKPALKLISLRLEPDVYDYFAEVQGANMQAKIRSALREFVQSKGDVKWLRQEQ
jgi:uncharacterized protein (DUF4415 family)